MQFGNREFRPRLWPTVATIILLPVLISLGFWQLDRAEQKKEIEQLYAEQQSMAAVELSKLSPEDDIEYRNVTVSGRFSPERQVLLDNQVHQQHAGYHVLTPLQIADSGKFILVNRGWVDGGLRRDKLPDISTPQGTLELKGRLKIPGGVGLELDEQSFTDKSWPLVVQWIEIDELELDKDQPYGFVRNWKIVSSSPEQSTSYAVQWFTLALALILIFIFVNSRKVDHG
jgi:surfeit locus 1 family protein